MPRKCEQGRRNEAEVDEAGLGLLVSEPAAAAGVVEDEGKLVKEVVGDEVDHLLEPLVHGERTLGTKTKSVSAIGLVDFSS